jgi:hypothetical protein
MATNAEETMPEQTQAEPQPEDQASSQYLDALKQLKVRSHSLSLAIYINIHKYIYIYQQYLRGGDDRCL